MTYRYKNPPKDVHTVVTRLGGILFDSPDGFNQHAEEVRCMPHLIQCCVSNDTGEFAEWIDETGMEARVQEDACLQRCGICYDSPFAVVDGNLVEADSPAALVSAVQLEGDE